MGPSLTTIFGGSVFGPSLRGYVVVAIGPSLTTIFSDSVFGPMMVVVVGPSLITIFGGRVFGPMPVPMGGRNFWLLGNSRLWSFSFIKTTLGRAVAAS